MDPILAVLLLPVWIAGLLFSGWTFLNATCATLQDEDPRRPWEYES